MNKWFVVHDLIAYHECRDFIFCPMTDKKTPFTSEPQICNFSKIKKDDLIVYYAFGAGVIVGIFQVMSIIQKSPENSNVKGRMVYNIKLLTDPEYYLDFKKLSVDSTFDSINKSYESNYSFKDFCQQMNDKDFLLIQQHFVNQNSPYKIKLKKQENSFGPTGWQLDSNLLSGILDYYNSRATSFASLFVASVFGLVTLSAIIQQTFNPTYMISTASDSLQVAISFSLYLLFSGAGLYTLRAYLFYTGETDRVKSTGIDIPYMNELERVWGVGAEKKIYNESSLRESIRKSGRKYGNSLLKIKKNPIFIFLYVTIIILMAFFIYWQFLGSPIENIVTHFFH